MAAEINRDWLYDQVKQFGSVREKYVAYERVLRTVLERLIKDVCPAAIVQTRAKGIASFAGKCVRRHDKVRDPVNEFTDLCGARVILQLQSDVEAMCRLVRHVFLIDEAQSQDTKQRLGHHEFG